MKQSVDINVNISVCLFYLYTLIYVYVHTWLFILSIKSGILMALWLTSPNSSQTITFIFGSIPLGKIFTSSLPPPVTDMVNSTTTVIQ